MHPIRQGKLNIIVGLAGLLLASSGGMALGATFDQHSVRDGFHLLTLVRFYLREGHSHGMPLSLYNLIVGLLLDQWIANPRWRRVASWATALSLVLPIGLAAKGAAGASATFPPIGLIGVAGMFVSLVLLLANSRAGLPQAATSGEN